MESEDLFVDTPDYSEELDAMDEPDNYEEPNENDDAVEDADGDGPEESPEKNNVDANINGDEATDAKSNEQRLSSLPLSRIKALMKLDPDFGLVGAEAVFLVTKATELFIDSLAKESFVHTAQGKKKTVQKRDVDQAIESVDALMFLEGTMHV